MNDCQVIVAEEGYEWDLLFHHLPDVTLIVFIIFFLIFWPCHRCGILVPGIQPVLHALAAQSFNHWTTREAQLLLFLNNSFISHNLSVFKNILQGYEATTTI